MKVLDKNNKPVANWKPLDEEVLTHPFPILKGDVLVVEARVIIVIEVDDVRYEYNDVQKFHLIKDSH